MRLQYEQATQAVVASAATGAAAGVTAAKSDVYSSRPGLEAVAEARLREMTDQCTHLFKLAASLNPGVLHGGSVAGFSMVPVRLCRAAGIWYSYATCLESSSPGAQIHSILQPLPCASTCTICLRTGISLHCLVHTCRSLQSVIWAQP